MPPIAMKPRQRKRTRYWAICTAAIASNTASPKARRDTAVTIRKCWPGTTRLGSAAGCVDSHQKMPAGKRSEPTAAGGAAFRVQGCGMAAAEAIAG